VAGAKRRTHGCDGAIGSLSSHKSVCSPSSARRVRYPDKRIPPSSCYPCTHATKDPKPHLQTPKAAKKRMCMRPHCLRCHARVPNSLSLQQLSCNGAVRIGKGATYFAKCTSSTATPGYIMVGTATAPSYIHSRNRAESDRHAHKDNAGINRVRTA
jgi:hypothetical protein